MNQENKMCNIAFTFDLQYNESSEGGVTLYCPNCKAEYKKGITICKDCGEVLVEARKMEVDIEERTAMDAVKLLSVDNTVNAELVLNLLRNNEIPCYCKDNGIGGYMNIYMGYSIFGKEIYVDRADYERAKEVLKVMEIDEDESAYYKESLQNQNKKSSLIARLILFGFVGSLLIAAVLNSLF